MPNAKKLGRTESMIKLAIQQKEAKLWYEEANTHVKAENLFKALKAYHKIICEVPFDAVVLGIFRNEPSLFDLGDAIY